MGLEGIYSEINKLGDRAFNFKDENTPSYICIKLKIQSQGIDILTIEANTSKENIAGFTNEKLGQLCKYIANIIDIINRCKTDLVNTLNDSDQSLAKDYDKMIAKVKQKPKTLMVKDIFTLFEFIGTMLGNEGFEVNKTTKKKEEKKYPELKKKKCLNANTLELLPGKIFIPVLRFDGESGKSIETDNWITETGEVCNIHTFTKNQSFLQVSYEESDKDKKHGCVLITCHEKKRGRYGRKVLLRTLIAQHFPHKTKNYDKIGDYKDPRLKYIDENREPKDNADNLVWYDHDEAYLQEQRRNVRKGKRQPNKKGSQRENIGIASTQPLSA